MAQILMVFLFKRSQGTQRKGLKIMVQDIHVKQKEGLLAES